MKTNNCKIESNDYSYGNEFNVKLGNMLSDVIRLESKQLSPQNAIIKNILKQSEISNLLL